MQICLAKHRPIIYYIYLKDIIEMLYEGWLMAIILIILNIKYDDQKKALSRINQNDP